MVFGVSFVAGLFGFGFRFALGIAVSSLCFDGGMISFDLWVWVDVLCDCVWVRLL